MSRRFGRRRKWALEAKIAGLEAQLQRNAGAVRAGTAALREIYRLRDEWGANFVAFSPIDGEAPLSPQFEYSRLMDAHVVRNVKDGPAREVFSVEHLRMLARERDKMIHFRFRLADGEAAYAISRRALQEFSPQSLERIVGREVARILIDQVKKYLG